MILGAVLGIFACTSVPSEPQAESPVADVARPGRFDDCFYRAVDEVRGDHGLHLDLRQQRDVRLDAAVLLGVDLLAPAAHHLAHGEAGDAELVERVLHLLESLVAGRCSRPLACGAIPLDPARSAQAAAAGRTRLQLKLHSAGNLRQL